MHTWKGTKGISLKWQACFSFMLKSVRYFCVTPMLTEAHSGALWCEALEHTVTESRFGTGESYVAPTLSFLPLGPAPPGSAPSSAGGQMGARRQGRRPLLFLAGPACTSERKGVLF